MVYDGNHAHVLRLYMLGPPRTTWNGRPLRIRRRQVRALLYRLAVARQPLSRDYLCFLFWSDVPQPRARRNLSHLFTHLRRTLPDPSLLILTRQDAQLAPQRVWTDTAAFTRYMDEWQEEASDEVLHRAVTLYRGPFLAGFALPTSAEFEQWLALERQLWQQRYLDALRHLVEACIARGALDEAIHHARAYLKIDHLAEDIHRRLIALYAAIGNRAAALRQYEICTGALERELGIAPLPETRALYEAVLAGQTIPLQQRAPSVSSAWLPGLQVPLVGRDEALATLARAYEETRTGQGHVVLISGEAGIGKSRLVQEFARPLPGRVLIANAQPGTQRLPYYPLAQVLRGHLLALLPRRDSMAPIWLAEITRLLPELRAQIPNLPPPLPGEPEEVRLRLFEALTQVLFALAKGTHPTVFCLDDLHWADQTTLEWLAYLTSRLAGHRLLVLATYRSEEKDAVRDLRRHLLHTGRVTELRLAELTTEDVRQIIRHVFGAVPNENVLARRLHRATGGNPFFLLETLRVLAEEQANIEAVDFDHLPLPDSVCEAVAARLARLTPQARQVLEAGSVLEGPFSFDLVHLIAGRSEAETASALEDLVARQLLTVEEGRYRFVHDLARRAVEQRLNPVRRQLLHRRAALAVARLHPNALVVQAYHLERAGMFKKALETYLNAAEKSQSLGAWEEVEYCYARALALLDVLDAGRCHPDHLRHCGAILMQRAHIRFLQGRLAERDADISRLEKLAEECGSDALRLQVHLARSRYFNLDGRYKEALAVARDGLRLAQRLEDDTARARLLARIGFAHYFRGEYGDALEALQKALTLEPKESAARAEVLSVLSYTYYLLADYPRSLAYRQQALAIRRRLGRLARVAEDLTDMGILHTRLNHLDEAKRYLQDALALARKIGSRPAESYALNNLGNLYYLLGNYPAALEHYRRSLVLQRATGSRRGEASALGNMGMVYLALGDYTEAENLLRQSLKIEEEIGYESGIAEGLAHLAQTLAAQGRVDAALDAAHRGLKVARHIGDRYCQVLALHTLADLYLRQGKPEQSLVRAREAVDVARGEGLEHGRVLALTAMARAHLALGQKQEALSAAEQAVALLDRLGALEGPAEWVYWVHARALAAMGERGKAARALCRARAALRAKAASIADPSVRRHYLHAARQRWQA